MNMDNGTIGEKNVNVLLEREKELNCLYKIEDYLNNRSLIPADLLNSIIRVIPLGFRFPEMCQARIVYKNNNYQTPGFVSTKFSESAEIEADNQVVGEIQVVYKKEVPLAAEGYFLEKEKQLIRIIARRIGQTLYYREMEQIGRGRDLEEKQRENRNKPEWQLLLDMLLKIDRDMVFYVSKKMINYLSRRGIREALGILQNININVKYVETESGEQNFPAIKRPLEDIQGRSEKTFELASKHLTDNEINVRLNKWMQEAKANILIRAVDSITASIHGIIEALKRYKKMSIRLFNPLTEHWIKTALIWHFFSEKLDFIGLASKYIEIEDFFEIIERVIYVEGSRGKLGGKSAGVFLAKHILKRESKFNPLLRDIKVPETWYITSDCLTEFLHYNNLEELKEQRYKDLSEVRIEYNNIIHLMKNSSLPPTIILSLSAMLDEVGENPLIVRSSSLLEDQMGTAFSGKYKSLFLANQGSKKERLEALMDAVTEVYASIFSPDSIQYRVERGLVDYPEEMGIMIQKVVGTRVGPYYFPLLSGVAFSNNEFIWSPRIKREDGLIRMAPGLGTRAVDRIGDDFPVLVSPGKPGLRVNTSPEEIRQYAPRKMDVLNLETNTFETVDASDILREYGKQIPGIYNAISVDKGNHMEKPMPMFVDFKNDRLLFTFEGIISNSDLIKKIDAILKVLKENLDMPVDIEFAYDGEDLYLLQCRPQSFMRNNMPSPIPQDIPQKDIIFNAKRYISNGLIPDITYIVYVDADEYGQLSELEDLNNIGIITGLLNSMLPRRQFILMGPGRWGSRGDIKLGVRVGYSDINNTAALIEIAKTKKGLIPELSFGTHFFQDMVEAEISYIPIYPDDEGIILNEPFLKKSGNKLADILPQYKKYDNVVHVIDVPSVTNGRILRILTNAELGEAVAFLAEPSFFDDKPQKMLSNPAKRPEDESYWRWRHYMAEKIAERMDLDYFGVEGVYLFGSTNTASAGPGSDIDLIIHFRGTPEQKNDLLSWLKGWSQGLSEINYLKTGYQSAGLLDVHIVTDEDISKKTSFAVKINSPTDPAYPLKLKNRKDEK